MKTRNKELLENLLDLACDYYTEKTDCGALKIPDNQSESQFIQEVLITCDELLKSICDE